MTIETIDHSSRAHAKLSASSSATWLNCTAAVRMQEKYPNETSNYAQEGTAAHEVADICLRKNLDAEDLLGRTIEGFEVDKDMANNVQIYLDYVRSFKGVLYPEQRVCFDNWVTDGFGTSDAIVMDTDNNTVHIIDLKFGKGVSVSAVGNTQGRLYALGVLQEYGDFYNIEKVVTHIVQPRIDNFSSEELTLEELLEWGEYVKQRVNEINTSRGKFNPSAKACQWCKAKNELTDGKGNVIQHACRAYADYGFNEIVDMFEEVMGEPEQLNDEQIAMILDRASMMESFVKSIKEDVHHRIEQGGTFKGYKLVAGRSTRKWKPEAEQVLSGELGEKAYNKKLIGLTEAEKLLGKAEVDALTTKEDGKPQLVKDSNPKQALEFVSDSQMFDVF